jgi:D-alanine--poly(phosphoribitol) ligase subunit 1
MKYCFETNSFIENEIAPTKIAIRNELDSIDWFNFKAHVLKLSKHLKSLNVTKTPIIIFGHKEIEFVISIYACINANIPYIPVDASTPSLRFNDILFKSKSSIIINCTNSTLNIDDFESTKYNDIDVNILYNENVKQLDSLTLENILYIIFTSGTTGTPKGVLIPREAVIDFKNWLDSDFEFKNDDVFINTALLSFDLSVYEIIAFAFKGATLILNSNNIIKNPTLFLEQIKSGTILICTPSFINTYTRSQEEEINNLSQIVFCGETLPLKIADRLINLYEKTKIVNTYGPTECTVATTRVQINKSIIEKYNVLPVGYCKSTSTINIVENEILISGKNVAKGYINEPELTEKQFINTLGQRTYKTGDLGFIEDNLLFCNGRKDNQIKFHGYRIEINEIDSNILKINNIKQSQTIPIFIDDKIKKIVSFYNTYENRTIERQYFIDELSKLIPEYMIPSEFVFQEIFPVNNNYKTDIKALEEIYFSNIN